MLGYIVTGYLSSLLMVSKMQPTQVTRQRQKQNLNGELQNAEKYINFFDVTKIGKRRAGVAQINKRRNYRQRESERER